MWARPSFAVASATCAGSFGSSAPGKPGLHIAECTGTRAGVTHDHECCVLLVPAFADIRAAGLFADGVQTIVAHDLLRGEIAGRHRRFDANPIGLPQDRQIRLVRLFGMARARVINEVEDDSHGIYLRLRVRPARSRDYACRIARQISRNTMAPMVAVISSPRNPARLPIEAFQKGSRRRWRP